MGAADLLERTKAKLQQRAFTTLSGQQPMSGLYIFFSFDLVNSTQYKTANPDDWPVVVMRFYEFVASELTTRLTSAILWKHIGDEVLFYKRLTDRKDIHKAVPAAYDALNTTISALHQGFPKTRELLSVKAAVWLAIATSIEPSDAEKIVAAPET
jgi:hypothetical protein